MSKLESSQYNSGNTDDRFGYQGSFIKGARLPQSTPTLRESIDNKLDFILKAYGVWIVDSRGGISFTEAKNEFESLLSDRIREAELAKNNAYWERNQLVGVLSRLYPSHLARHDENDKDWEDDWRNIVCIHTPVGQATWHLQDDDMPMFAHLERGADHWDGHTTEEKYKRLSALQEKRKP